MGRSPRKQERPEASSIRAGFWSDLRRIDPSGARHETGPSPSNLIVSPTSSRVVLVVDDDQDIRDALCELLEDEGYRAVAAANGAEALGQLRAAELPCVI